MLIFTGMREVHGHLATAGLAGTEEALEHGVGVLGGLGSGRDLVGRVYHRRGLSCVQRQDGHFI